MAVDHIANATPVTDGRVARVKQELRDAGMTTLGMLKFASRYVPSILHTNGHVKGMVHGVAVHVMSKGDAYELSKSGRGAVHY